MLAADPRSYPSVKTIKINWTHATVQTSVETIERFDVAGGVAISISVIKAIFITLAVLFVLTAIAYTIYILVSRHRVRRQRPRQIVFFNVNSVH